MPVKKAEDSIFSKVWVLSVSKNTGTTTTSCTAGKRKVQNEIIKIGKAEEQVHPQACLASSPSTAMRLVWQQRATCVASAIVQLHSLDTVHLRVRDRPHHQGRLENGHEGCHMCPRIVFQISCCQALAIPSSKNARCDHPGMYEKLPNSHIHSQNLCRKHLHGSRASSVSNFRPRRHCTSLSFDFLYFMFFWDLAWYIGPEAHYGSL